MLCQTLNAEFAPQGIHVAHVVVDGPVDAPDTLGKLLGDKFEAYNLNVAGYMLKSDMGNSFIRAVELIDSYWRVVEFPEPNYKPAAAAATS